MAAHVMAAASTDAGPLAFPVPVIRQCVMRRVQVRVSAQDIVERAAVESVSGKCYELGRTIKEAIYGQVCHAILLVCVQEALYERTFPIQQLAIKVYSKGIESKDTLTLSPPPLLLILLLLLSSFWSSLASILRTSSRRSLLIAISKEMSKERREEVLRMEAREDQKEERRRMEILEDRFLLLFVSKAKIH